MNSTDVLAHAASNAALAIILQDSGTRLGHDYTDLVARRMDTLISYLRMES